MKLLKQIIYDFKTQPVIGSVSVIGTAMSILLVMVVMMIRQVQVEPIYPESKRDRLLYDYGVSMRSDGMSGSSAMGYALIDKIYGDLKNAEKIGVVSPFLEPSDVLADGGTPEIVDVRNVDENIWQIYDYVFIAGAPFTRSDIEAGKKVAVITESLARRLFGTADAVGKTIQVKRYPYRVTGVVKDISSLMGWSYAQCWLPVEKSGEQWMRMDPAIDKYFGEYSVVALAKSVDDVEALRQEMRSKNATLNSELKALGWEREDTEYPYTQESFYSLKGTNRAPDTKTPRVMRMVLIGIILLVPAINLSSMTQSRLRQRRHEIGVRRAFGATKREVMFSIIRENFVVTLLGGVIGLILAFVFSWLFTSLFYDPFYSWQSYSQEVSVNAAMLLRWSTFGWTILFCFILNLLSAGIPAWRAASVSPVDAINNIEK